MRTLSIFLLFILFALNPVAQELVPLSGSVTVGDQKFGGVLITVENNNLGTITNAGGQFELQVPTGQQTIMFRVNGILRHYHVAEFNKDNKYHWDVTIGPKYSKSHLIRMKNEGREDELELSEVDSKIYTQIHGTVGFDEMLLPGAGVKIIEGNNSTTTNNKGEFSLWVKEGLQTIEFSFKGFEPFSHKIQIDSKKKYTLQAKFGPAYSKEFLAQQKAAGTLNELKQSACEVQVAE